MKEFNYNNYIEDIKKKIPAYDLMLEIIFQALIPASGKTIKRVLIIGGQSEEVIRTKKVFPDVNITLVEPSKVMLDEVKRHTNNIEGTEFILSKFEDYKTNRNFDLCISLLVLQFVENRDLFLKKVYDTLKPDGELVISIFSNEMLEYWRNFAIARGADKEQVEKTFKTQEAVMKSFSTVEAEAALRKSGFKKIEKVLQVLSTALYNVKK